MLQVRLFGTFDIRTTNGPVPSPARRDTLRLWQYLLLHRSLPTTRDTIATALWPEASADKARGYLRINLHALTALLSNLAPDTTWLQRDSRTIQWSSTDQAWVDLEEFETLGRRTALTSGSAADLSTDELARMVALYRGDLLADVADDWAAAPRSHARAHVTRALEVLAAAQQSAGDLELAAASLQSLLVIDPLSENAARRLMSLLAQAGDRTRALVVFQELSEALRVSLAVAPGAETDDLAARIAADTHPPAQPTASGGPLPGLLPAPISRFIGRHDQISELIGLVGSERLVTLLGPGGAGKTRLGLEVAHRISDAFAHGIWFTDLTRLATGDDPWPEVARVLGVPPSSGSSARDSVCRYLTERQALIVLDNCEHVLASVAQLAADLLSSASGVRVLATSRSPLGVDGELRWSIPPLGLPDSGSSSDSPPVQSEAVQLFIERVRSIRSRYTPSAADTPAIEAICRRVDGLPLAIELAAARTNVLSVPDLALRLEEGFRLLRLDTQSLPERHRTIDACIDWSVRLIHPSEQTLLGDLSIFSSTFTMAAAEAVGAVDSAGDSTRLVLDSLGRLVDVGLVAISDGPAGVRRFRLLQPIRAHAYARANTDDLATARQRHATYFVGRAEAVEPRLQGARDAALESELDAEIPDFRAALDWSIETGSVESAMRLAGAVWRVWYDRGHSEHERARIESVVAEHGHAVTPRSRGRAQIAAGVLAYRVGDMPAALHHFESAVGSLEVSSDAESLMRALEYLGIVYTVRGEPQRAQEAYQRLLELVKVANDSHRQEGIMHTMAQMQAWQGNLPIARDTLVAVVATASHGLSTERLGDFRLSLARVLYELGSYREAAELIESGLADAPSVLAQREHVSWQIKQGLVASATGRFDIANAVFRDVAQSLREAGNALELARTFHNLAEVSLAQGDYPTARTYLTESRRQKVEVNDQWGLVYTDIGLATLAHETGAYDEALATAQAAVAAARERQDKCLIAWALQTAARAAIALGRLDEAAAALGECAALLTVTCEQRRIAMALERSAMLAAARAQHATAARLLGAADAIRTAIGSPPTHGEAADREVCNAALREAIGAAAFDAEANAGMHLLQPDALDSVVRLCGDIALSA